MYPLRWSLRCWCRSFSFPASARLTLGWVADRPVVKAAVAEGITRLYTALRELHRAHDVGEEDGDQLALTAERALGGENLCREVPRGVGARLGGDRGRREGRATIVAEPRASGVLVATRLAAHWTWPILASSAGKSPWTDCLLWSVG